jgi:hypothetical protein
MLIYCQRGMESVTGFAPAFSVRETALLLLEDTDKNLQTKGEVGWSYKHVSPRGDVEDRRPYRADSFESSRQRARMGLQPRPGPPTISRRRGSVVLSPLRLPEGSYIMAVIVTVTNFVRPTGKRTTNENESRERLELHQLPFG